MSKGDVPRSHHPSSSSRGVDPPWTPFAKALSYGGLKELVVQAREGSIGLHGGLPPALSFPLKKITVELNEGDTLEIDSETSQSQYNVLPEGLPELQKWAEGFTRSLVGLPPESEHKTVLTGGSSQGLDVAMSLFLCPGDVILLEEYTYSHFLESVVLPRGYRSIPIPADELGIVPQDLSRIVLELRRTERLAPKLLYVIPSGQNPTGSIATPERIREVYDICRTHGIFILEDDPYCLLRYPSRTQLYSSCSPSNDRSKKDRGGDLPSQHMQDNMPGVRDLIPVPSYLSCDGSNIVIRLDSFSKILAPGFRIGWITAAPDIAEKFAMAIQASTIGAPMISQTIIAKMLSHWGEEGLHVHLQRVQSLYAERAAATIDALEREAKDLLEWKEPTAGMFLWLKVIGVNDSSRLMQFLIEEGVLLAPGKIFSADVGNQSPYFRLSFSNTCCEQLDEAIGRLARVLRIKLVRQRCA